LPRETSSGAILESKLCSASGIKAVECEDTPFTPRIVGVAVGTSDRSTVRLEVEFRVLSEYLFIHDGSLRLFRLSDGKGRVEVFRGFPAYHKSENRRLYFIPGSTVKGAVRSRLELLSRCSVKAGCKCLGDFSVKDGIKFESFDKVPAHFRRHVAIWCESIFEERSLPAPALEAGNYSILEDLFGIAGRERLSLQSRALFSDFPMVEGRIFRLYIEDPHANGERYYIEAVGRCSRFRGTITLVNASLEDLGLVLYGLGLEKKVLCNRGPRLLMGRFKYVCPRVHSGEDVWRRALFGIVESRVVGATIYDFSRGLSGESLSGKDLEDLLSEAIRAAASRYPALPGPSECFDEVSRRLSLDPDCRLSEGRC